MPPGLVLAQLPAAGAGCYARIAVAVPSACCSFAHHSLRPIKYLNLGGGAIRTRTALCAAALALVALAPLFVPPAEDAAILFQYSDNLARTGVISYIAHGPRVEGATDFLWMAVLALARCLGISPHAATGPLNALALAGIAWIFSTVSAARLLPAKAEGPGKMSGAVLLLTPCVFLLTPQMAAALSGFSVLPFGLLLVLLFWAYVRQKHRLVAVSALLLCLTRPDGIVFALPLLGFELGRRRWAAAAWRDQVLGFYLPAALYMAWRVHYFHQLCPLPFLVKSQAQRWLGFLVIRSIEDISRYLSLGLLTLALLWRWKVLRGETLAIAVCGIVVPSLFYVTMRLDQNVADRFFFYLLLAPAFLLLMHSERLAAWKTRSRAAGVLVLAALFLWPYCFALVHLCTDRYRTDALVARKLHRQDLQGSMALSEAGTLAYKTGWPATDLWGLNTPRFSRAIPQPADIARLGADLIVLRYHTCRASPEWPPPSSVRTWRHMAQNVLRGAASSEYEEFVLPYSQSRFASAVERFVDGRQTYLCYFVRPSYPGRQALERIIASAGGARVEPAAIVPATVAVVPIAQR